MNFGAELSHSWQVLLLSFPDPLKEQISRVVLSDLKIYGLGGKKPHPCVIQETGRNPSFHGQLQRIISCAWWAGDEGRMSEDVFSFFFFYKECSVFHFYCH